MSYLIKPHWGLLQLSTMIALTALLPDAPSQMAMVALWVVSAGLTVLVVFCSIRMLPLLLLVIGALIGGHHGLQVKSGWLDERLQGLDQVISGRIVSLPVQSGQVMRFDFKPDGRASVVDSDFKLPGRIRLSWFNGPAEAQAVQPGERWQLTLRLRRPHGFASPGAFDYEAFLARQGVQATGYIKSGVLLSKATLLDQPFDQLRMKLRSWLETAASPESRGMLVALATGDKSGISQQQWQRLNISGTTHLMVISGLHIGLMAAVGMAMAGLLARLGLLPLKRLPLPLLGGALALTLAMFYALLAGFSIPVQRALVMLLVALSGPLAGIKSSTFTLWATALAAVLAIEPLAVTSQGFWYSFMAVAALLFGVSGRSHRLSWRAKLGKPQWVVFCVLTPLLLVNGQAVSPLSPFINLVAIPLIGLLVVPLLLLASCLYPWIPWLANHVLFLADGLISVFNGLLSLCEPWLLAIPPQLATDSLGMILAVLGMFLLISPSALGLRWLAPFLLLPLLLPVETLPAHGQAEVKVLDVGQGLSVLIRTRNHVLLYDTGDRFSEQVTAADRVILPALASARVRHIDRVIISHGDRDHAGGLATLVERLGPLDVWSGSRIPDFTGAVKTCNAGDRWEWDGVQFQVLAGGGYVRSNESSCVVKVLAGNDSVLLPGDISGRVERRLMAAGVDLSSRKLLAAHHGSRHSSTSDFLGAVKPEVVIFSAGYGNRFGHPARETLSRVELTGAHAVNTASDGTLTFTLGGSDNGINGYRHTHRRYWW